MRLTADLSALAVAAEEDGAAGAPQSLKRFPVLDHPIVLVLVIVVPVETSDSDDFAGAGTREHSRLPEEECLPPESLRVSRGVGNPTLDSLVLKGETVVYETGLIEVSLKVVAIDPTAVLLLGGEVKFECHSTLLKELLGTKLSHQNYQDFDCSNGTTPHLSAIIIHPIIRFVKVSLKTNKKPLFQAIL